eukprot:Rmarinus@m.2781
MDDDWKRRLQSFLDKTETKSYQKYATQSSKGALDQIRRESLSVRLPHSPTNVTSASTRYGGLGSSEIRATSPASAAPISPLSRIGSNRRLPGVEEVSGSRLNLLEDALARVRDDHTSITADVGRVRERLAGVEGDLSHFKQTAQQGLDDLGQRSLLAERRLDRLQSMVEFGYDNEAGQNTDSRPLPSGTAPQSAVARLGRLESEAAEVRGHVEKLTSHLVSEVEATRKLREVQNGMSEEMHEFGSRLLQTLGKVRTEQQARQTLETTVERLRDRADGSASRAAVEEIMNAFSARVGGVEGRLQGVETRLLGGSEHDSLLVRVASLERRYDRAEADVSDVETRVARSLRTSLMKDIESMVQSAVESKLGQAVSGLTGHDDSGSGVSASQGAAGVVARLGTVSHRLSTVETSVAVLEKLHAGLKDKVQSVHESCMSEVSAGLRGVLEDVARISEKQVTKNLNEMEKRCLATEHRLETEHNARARLDDLIRRVSDEFDTWVNKVQTNLSSVHSLSAELERLSVRVARAEGTSESLEMWRREGSFLQDVRELASRSATTVVKELGPAVAREVAEKVSVECARGAVGDVARSAAQSACDAAMAPLHSSLREYVRKSDLRQTRDEICSDVSQSQRKVLEEVVRVEHSVSELTSRVEESATASRHRLKTLEISQQEFVEDMSNVRESLKRLRTTVGDLMDQESQRHQQSIHQQKPQLSATSSPTRSPPNGADFESDTGANFAIAAAGQKAEDAMERVEVTRKELAEAVRRIEASEAHLSRIDRKVAASEEDASLRESALASVASVAEDKIAALREELLAGLEDVRSRTPPVDGVNESSVTEDLADLKQLILARIEDTEERLGNVLLQVADMRESQASLSEGLSHHTATELTALASKLSSLDGRISDVHADTADLREILTPVVGEVQQLSRNSAESDSPAAILSLQEEVSRLKKSLETLSTDNVSVRAPGTSSSPKEGEGEAGSGPAEKLQRQVDRLEADWKVVSHALESLKSISEEAAANQRDMAVSLDAVEASCLSLERTCASLDGRVGALEGDTEDLRATTTAAAHANANTAADLSSANEEIRRSLEEMKESVEQNASATEEVRLELHSLRVWSESRAQRKSEPGTPKESSREDHAPPAKSKTKRKRKARSGLIELGSDDDVDDLDDDVDNDSDTDGPLREDMDEMKKDIKEIQEALTKTAKEVDRALADYPYGRITIDYVLDSMHKLSDMFKPLQSLVDNEDLQTLASSASTILSRLESVEETTKVCTTLQVSSSETADATAALKERLTNLDNSIKEITMQVSSLSSDVSVLQQGSAPGPGGSEASRSPHSSPRPGGRGDGKGAKGGKGGSVSPTLKTAKPVGPVPMIPAGPIATSTLKPAASPDDTERVIRAIEGKVVDLTSRMERLEANSLSRTPRDNTATQWMRAEITQLKSSLADVESQVRGSWSLQQKSSEAIVRVQERMDSLEVGLVSVYRSSRPHSREGSRPHSPASMSPKSVHVSSPPGPSRGTKGSAAAGDSPRRPQSDENTGARAVNTVEPEDPALMARARGASYDNAVLATAAVDGSVVLVLDAQGNMQQWCPDENIDVPVGLDLEYAEAVTCLCIDESVGIAAAGRDVGWVTVFPVSHTADPCIPEAINFRTPPVHCMDLCSEYLALGLDGGLVGLYSVTTGEEVQTVAVADEDVVVMAVALSEDIMMLGAGDEKGSLSVTRLDVQQTMPLPSHNTPVSCIAFGGSASQRTFASASEDGVVCIFDVTSNPVVLHTLRSPHTEGVSAISLTADGAYLGTGGVNGGVCLWVVETGDLIRQFIADDVVNVTLTWDSQWLIIAQHSGDVRAFPLDLPDSLLVDEGDRTRPVDDTMNTTVMNTTVPKDDDSACNGAHDARAESSKRDEPLEDLVDRDRDSPSSDCVRTSHDAEDGGNKPDPTLGDEAAPVCERAGGESVMAARVSSLDVTLHPGSPGVDVSDVDDNVVVGGGESSSDGVLPTGPESEPLTPGTGSAIARPSKGLSHIESKREAPVDECGNSEEREGENVKDGGSGGSDGSGGDGGSDGVSNEYGADSDYSYDGLDVDVDAEVANITHSQSHSPNSTGIHSLNLSPAGGGGSVSREGGRSVSPTEPDTPTSSGLRSVPTGTPGRLHQLRKDMTSPVARMLENSPLKTQGKAGADGVDSFALGDSVELADPDASLPDISGISLGDVSPSHRHASPPQGSPHSATSGPGVPRTGVDSTLSLSFSQFREGRGADYDDGFDESAFDYGDADGDDDSDGSGDGDGADSGNGSGLFDGADDNLDSDGDANKGDFEDNFSNPHGRGTGGSDLDESFGGRVADARRVASPPVTGSAASHNGPAAEDICKAPDRAHNTEKTFSSLGAGLLAVGSDDDEDSDEGALGSGGEPGSPSASSDDPDIEYGEGHHGGAAGSPKLSTSEADAFRWMDSEPARVEGATPAEAEISPGASRKDAPAPGKGFLPDENSSDESEPGQSGSVPPGQHLAGVGSLGNTDLSQLRADLRSSTSPKRSRLIFGAGATSLVESDEENENDAIYAYRGDDLADDDDDWETDDDGNQSGTGGDGAMETTSLGLGQDDDSDY